MYNNKNRYLISLGAGDRKCDHIQRDPINELMRVISYLPAHDRWVAQKNTRIIH